MIPGTENPEAFWRRLRELRGDADRQIANPRRTHARDYYLGLRDVYKCAVAHEAHLDRVKAFAVMITRSTAQHDFSRGARDAAHWILTLLGETGTW